MQMFLRRFLKGGIALGAVLAILAACAQETKPKPSAEDTMSAALWELASGAEDAIDYEKAASYYDRLVERHPNDKRALVGYTRNLRYLGLPKDSIKAIQTRIETVGEDVDLLLELGKSQLSAALINDAHDTFERAIKLDASRWDAHSAKGIILDRLGQFDPAQKSYRKALELSPENVAVQNNLALSLAQSGKLDEGIDILKALAESEYSTAQSRQNLAMLYGLKGDFEKAQVLAQIDLPIDMAAANLATFKALYSAPAAADSAKKAASNVRPAPQSNPAGVSPEGERRNGATAPRPRELPVFVSRGSANVRKGPSTDHPPVAFLQPGQEVSLLGKSANAKWLFVALADGRRGYVFHKLIKRK